MPSSPPFSFEELAGVIYKFTLDIFAKDDGTFGRKANEEELTREQGAALFIGDAMQAYAETHSAMEGEADSFILEPDWRYVRMMMSDLLTQIYVTQTSEYEKVAAERKMPLDQLAAAIMVTTLKQYRLNGQKHDIQISIPAKYLDQDIGL
jgi:hypothetical protein